MRASPSRPFLSALVFMILETISIFLVYEKGIIQRNRIQTAADEISSFCSEQISLVSGWFSLRSTNINLTEENASLLKSNFILQEQLNRYMTGMDSLPVPDEYLVIPSTVVSNSTGRQHNRIILNRGREDGVTEGMGVVTPRGVVGYVEAVSGHYSRVVSMLDIDAKFSVILKKNGTFGSLSWDGVNAESVTVYDMPLHTELTVGDTLISSGYSTIFPYGIPVGTISMINLNDGINYELQVALLENFRSLRYVYILGLHGQQELSALMKEDD